MNKFVIKVNRKKLYVYCLFEFNSMTIPIMTDNVDNAKTFDKKEGEKLVNKLSKNYKSLVLQQIDN